MSDCIHWSDTEGQHVLHCPDDICRNSGTTLCGLDEGVDFHEGCNFYDDGSDVGWGS